MGPFWQSFFDDLKDRGRDTSFFVLTLAALFVCLVGAGILAEMDDRGQVTQVLRWLAPVVALGVIWWMGMVIQRARKRRRERLDRGPLSDDELIKARRKLAKSRKG